MSNKIIPESCRPQNSVLNALPFTFPHNRCLTQPAAATHRAACTFPLMSGVRMGSFLIPFYPSLTTVELSDWLGSWQLKHLVLMYKTNINKKSCTDVALTNPRQQEKKQHQQMKGEKKSILKGEERKKRNPPKTILHKFNFRLKCLTTRQSF